MHEKLVKEYCEEKKPWEEIASELDAVGAFDKRAVIVDDALIGFGGRKEFDLD